MVGGAGSLKVGAVVTFGAGGAASVYFAGDNYLVSTNLLLEADVSSFVIPTDAAVPLLAYFLLMSSCLKSSVILLAAVIVLISGIAISNLLFCKFSYILFSSSSVRSLLQKRLISKFANLVNPQCTRTQKCYLL